MEGLESFFTSGEQFYLFILSCMLGIPIGIAFDFLRVFRIMIPHNKIAVAFEDLLFLAFYGVFIMCFTVSMSRSEYRFFYSIGNILGFGIYFVTIGNAVTSVIKQVFIFVKRFIYKPVKKFALICEKIKGFFVGSFQNVKSSKKNIQIPLIDDSDLLYNSIGRKKKRRKNVNKIGSKSKKEKTNN